MIDMSTEYLGLKLANPLVPSSSPLTGELDSAKKLEDAGASALVLPSLFEETIAHEQKLLERFVHSQALGHYEAQSYQRYRKITAVSSIIIWSVYSNLNQRWIFPSLPV